MRKSCLLLIITLLLMQSGQVFSQNWTQTIKGTVLDKITRNPLIGANVIILNSDPLIGTTTDIDGKFRIEGIPVGRTSLKISFIGYADAIISNIEISSAKELVLNVELEEKVITGKEVIISANAGKFDPINKMASVSAREFSIEEADLFAGARSDISRMAANFAGVNGTSDSRNDLIIRGNTPSGLLWRLDDVEIANPNHFAAFGTTGGPISIFRNNMLSNSDFITAAFPAEYGNAIAGVFDLRLRNGNNDKHEFMGQVAFNGIELCAEGPLNRKKGASYIIDYRYSTLDLFSKIGIQLGTGQGIPKYQDMMFKVNLPQTKIGTLTIFGFGGLSNIAFLDSQKDTTKEKIDFYGQKGWDLTNYSNQAMIGISNTFPIGKTAFGKVTLASAYHNFTTLNDSVTPVTLSTYPYDNSAYSELKNYLLFYINKKFNARHNLKAGFNISVFYNDLLDTVYNTDVRQFRNKIDFVGYYMLAQPYAEWQFKPSDDITLNAGMHLQYFNYNNSYSVEPRVSFKWNFYPTHSMSFGYGLHSQMITSTVYFNQVMMPDGYYARTNTGLDFIRSHHFAFGYDWNINECTRLKLEGYYQYLFNVPVNKNRPDSYSLINEGSNFTVYAPDSLENRGVGRNYGIELTMERSIYKGFYYLATGSIYQSKYTGSDGIERNTAFNGNYSINLLLGKEFNIKFRKKKPERRKKTLLLSAKMCYAGGQRYTPINIDESVRTQKTVYYDNEAYSLQFPNYWRTDFKIGYKMNAKHVTIEWSVEVTNIFNQKNVFNQVFNKKDGVSYFTYQLGRVIIPQYRIIF